MAKNKSFVQSFSERAAAQVLKNVGEESAQSVGAYFAATPFLSQLHSFMVRLFGRSATEWLGKGTGIILASITGTPDLFVSIVMTVFKMKRPEAERIVGETLDQFIRVVVQGVKEGAPVDSAVQIGIDDILGPKLSAIKDKMPEIAGIVHRGVGVTVHALDCQKMYRYGVGIRASSEGPATKDVLIEGAAFMTYAQMQKEGIDINCNGCDCRGITKEISASAPVTALVNATPQTIRHCRIAMKRGSKQDQELERAFLNALQRLRLASPTEVHPEDLSAFERKLESPVWTVDLFRLAIQDWNPDEKNTELDKTMKSAMLAFGVNGSWPDKARSFASRVLMAVYTGKDTDDALMSVKAGFAKVSDEATAAKVAADKKRKQLRILGLL